MIDHLPRDFFSELAALTNDEGLYEKGWRERFSPHVDFGSFKELFLNSTAEIVHWIFCPERMRCTHVCPLEIVQDISAYYAVCVEGKVSPLPISAEELEFLKFDYSTFHRKLSEILPIDPAVEQTGNGQSWQLGTLRYGRGARRRVFITYVPPREVAMEIVRLSVFDTIPMIVFTPYHIVLRHEDNLILRTIEVIRLAINEIVSVDRHCRFTLFPALPRQIRTLFKTAEKLSETGDGITMPVGISWADIRFHFLDAHTVSCRINKTIMTLSFHDLGMVNQKNGKPDKNWLYLMQFAIHGGKFRVDWQTSARASREQQRKRRLSKALQAFFHIDSEPIVFERESASYICQFQIKPETEVTRYRAPLK